MGFNPTLSRAFVRVRGVIRRKNKSAECPTSIPYGLFYSGAQVPPDNVKSKEAKELFK